LPYSAPQSAPSGRPSRERAGGPCTSLKALKRFIIKALRWRHDGHEPASVLAISSSLARAYARECKQRRPVQRVLDPGLQGFHRTSARTLRPPEVAVRQDNQRSRTVYGAPLERWSRRLYRMAAWACGRNRMNARLGYLSPRACRSGSLADSVWLFCCKASLEHSPATASRWRMLMRPLR
jgi:hypothetical protein